MSVLFGAYEIRRVVWRMSSSVESLSVDKAGAMMEPRKDFHVWVAPSTRTAEMFMCMEGKSGLLSVWFVPSNGKCIR